MTPEFKNAKISKVREEVPDVETDLCLVALQNSGWDAVAAIQYVKIEKLTR